MGGVVDEHCIRILTATVALALHLTCAFLGLAVGVRSRFGTIRLRSMTFRYPRAVQTSRWHRRADHLSLTVLGYQELNGCRCLNSISAVSQLAHCLCSIARVHQMLHNCLILRMFRRQRRIHHCVHAIASV